MNLINPNFIVAQSAGKCYNEYKMSPTSISGGGNLLTGGELISPASLKGQEEVLPSAKLEQWPYNKFAVLLSAEGRCQNESYNPYV